jgi:hypothetical protein
VQQSFHYDAAKAAAFSGQQASTQEAFRQQQEAAQRQRQEATVTSPRKPDPTPSGTESIATSGIETLSPITVQLKDELLSALKMTDELDALYKRGCSSAEFITAALPVERVVMKLQKKLPKADPRHDLLVNTFEAYQNAAVAMKANEQGRGERPSSVIAAAQVRKHLLTKILQGNMTPEEKKVYYAWRNALTNP